MGKIPAGLKKWQDAQKKKKGAKKGNKKVTKTTKTCM
jgi:hypothetical protein